MFLNIVAGMPAGGLNFLGSLEPLLQSLGQGIRVGDRPDGPGGQKASRMNRALVPRADEHRHARRSGFDDGVEAAFVKATLEATPMEATLMESPAHVRYGGDRV